ncbi:MAG: ribosome biogenesis GTPase Der [Deltaproteobacteria bacterium HGW-Deltaproteobacteria-4]|nr:MAG: ribosome biogenesis GTPase Der [Deltaproteobacteria bacterium HGW-Deltaproteobacteria-4]
MLPIVAIVGRPNVGKSTLFNKILGQRKAIVDDFPGVTRDRNYAVVTRYGAPFTMIDTGGFEPVSEERLLVQMREQSQLAVEEADLIIFLLDGRQGLTPADREVAGILRRSNKKILFAVNKIDGSRQEEQMVDFFALAAEELYPVSAEHGHGVGELIDVVLSKLPHSTTAEDIEDMTCLAVIGRPNVGKSSLINKLLGEERMVANPLAGTTRDSIDTPFTYNKKRYLLVDTAGIRRKGKVSAHLEKFSIVQALKAMDRASLVLLVIDAQEGVTDQDVTVAGYAYERGKAILLVVNKWDLVEKDNASMGKFVEKLRLAFKFLPQVPIVFVSAVTGQRVTKIMKEVEVVAEQYSRRASTPELNRMLEDAIRLHQPPIVRGRRMKLFYMTQTGTCPPHFVIFANSAEEVHFSYERYLLNQIRETFNFGGVPLRLSFRARQ